MASPSHVKTSLPLSSHYFPLLGPLPAPMSLLAVMHRGVLGHALLILSSLELSTWGKCREVTLPDAGKLMVVFHGGLERGTERWPPNPHILSLHSAEAIKLPQAK